MKNNLVLLLMLSAVVCFASSYKNGADELEFTQKVSATYDGWIDLFGWGTSGWNSGAKVYQPWATSTSYSDYYPGGSYSNNLTGGYAKADWGVYNAISNGGDEPNR